MDQFLVVWNKDIGTSATDFDIYGRLVAKQNFSRPESVWLGPGHADRPGAGF